MDDMAKAGHGYRRTLSGRVVSAKMQKTVVVECVSRTKDSMYGKFVRQRKRYKAHDESLGLGVGDEVEIQEHAPISKHKRFVVTRIVKRFVQE